MGEPAGERRLSNSFTTAQAARSTASRLRRPPAVARAKIDGSDNTDAFYGFAPGSNRYAFLSTGSTLNSYRTADLSAPATTTEFFRTAIAATVNCTSGSSTRSTAYNVRWLDPTQLGVECAERRTTRVARFVRPRPPAHRRRLRRA